MRFPLLNTLIAPHAGAHVAPSIPAASHEASVDERLVASHAVHAFVDVLLLGAVPPSLRSALDAHYVLHEDLDIEAPRFRAIVAAPDAAIDAPLLARLRGVRIIVLLGPHAGAVDLGAATSHSIRVALAGDDPGRAVHVTLANLDACFRGHPLPSAIV
jgi:hypothetical protein